MIIIPYDSIKLNLENLDKIVEMSYKLNFENQNINLS